MTGLYHPNKTDDHINDLHGMALESQKYEYTVLSKVLK